MRRDSGFTLIELMVVVSIVAILMAIAVPAFQRQVLKGHRAAAQGEMMILANRQAQYLLSERRYFDPNDVSYTWPDEVSKHYICSYTRTASPAPPSFTITCAPRGEQTRDGGPLTLNNLGVKTPPDLWE
ncbi:prepilin-type N-terminal cleavage/methylation domain-containing protein [Mangrovimicrobium sediminis]|uniref:Prepilin-type N-terminal cleavage/methylation domain-containing protein n=1 Tax=Mangrovimicrobium sediminis TaxID=2562682 RepID=A0A4Z0LWW7_9GAMM|nr:type IV pilin protein [Haliea sp. SAOS-164]TGD71575.1 prepilin-type N-terminal cleavage/methylation domain-containing protein [Haliea sp. SAOS-164]